MITTIILVVLIGVGIYLVENTNHFGLEFIGTVIVMILSAYLVAHVFFTIKKEYDYESFVAKRNAFEITLDASRESGNQYETAAIVKEVASWNIALAKKKYDSKHWYFGQYSDNRIENLEYIK